MFRLKGVGDKDESEIEQTIATFKKAIFGDSLSLPPVVDSILI